MDEEQVWRVTVKFNSQNLWTWECRDMTHLQKLGALIMEYLLTLFQNIYRVNDRTETAWSMAVKFSSQNVWIWGCRDKIHLYNNQLDCFYRYNVLRKMWFRSRWNDHLCLQQQVHQSHHRMYLLHPCHKLYHLNMEINNFIFESGRLPL